MPQAKKKDDELFDTNVEPIHKSDKLRILRKLSEVMDEVGYIAKDAKNAHQKYTYASERAIKEAVGAAFRNKQVIFQVSQSTPFILGNVLILPIEYTFYDVLSGESLTGTFNGAGHTRDDKGVYAALTGAIKYILTTNLLIPTGDDPENDHNSAPQPARESDPTQPDDGSLPRMKATKGTVETPTFCAFCNERHICAGDTIVKYEGKWGKETCFEELSAS